MVEGKDAKRETMEIYVTGNASDSAAVHEVLNELASFDDATILQAQQSVKSMLEMMDDERPALEGAAGDEADSDEAGSDYANADLYEALEKVAELLSEIRLYNKVQRVDPSDSTFLSKQLGI